jgi:hypothetical protein
LYKKYSIATNPVGINRNNQENFNGLISITAAANVKIAAEAPTK